MCGICGKLNFENNKPVERQLIQRMASALAHRGPDDEGVYVKGNIGLGHRRLSIIDLSPAGHQPMCNEDRTVWIVFNGEIYNFLDLKEELLKKGHIFRSNSDTEVILHLYEEEGPECVKRLRGMFAFGIWDDRNKSLFLARDRVGKKPLFYYSDNRCLIFASEIKAILQDPAVGKKPDFIAIHHYLTYQSVPSPFSAFEGIKKLPPAHYLVCKDSKIGLKRYWKLSYLPKFSIKTPAQEKELEVELLNMLKEAVRIRLISDVPLGAFLSGGIDSSAVVALMSQIMEQPVKTFSIGFYEESYDETKYAKIVADRFGTHHTEFRVKPDAMEILPKLVWHYNEPFADSSAIPTYYVSKLAREYVTVALSGDAGDENFAGYPRSVTNELLSRYDKIPAVFRKWIIPSIIAILPAMGGPRSFIRKLKNSAWVMSLSPELRNAHSLCHFNNRDKALLYTDGFKAKTRGIDSFKVILEKYSESDADNFLERTLYTDVNLYLADTLLVKVDIASMANSLEVRCPFLDHKFMEFAARIPANLKLKGTETKYILKKALRGILPDETLDREKMGFGVPIDRWFRNELKEMVYDTLLGRRCIERGYFNRAFVQRILDEHGEGKRNWHSPIWNLLMLELWHQMFIDRTLSYPINMKLK